MFTEIISAALVIAMAFLGYNIYGANKQNKELTQKIEKARTEIAGMDTVSLVGLANSIIASRRKSNR